MSKGGLLQKRHVPGWLKILVVISFLLLTCAILQMMPSGLIALSPHAPVDLQHRIRIDGKAVDPLDGRLYLVGVQEERVSLLQKYLMKLDDSVSFQRDATGEDKEKKVGHAMIMESKRVAAAVAFNLLGEKVRISGHGVSVVDILRTGPSYGHVKRGDIIALINGQAVHSEIDISNVIGALPPGSKVTLGIRRNQRPALITLRTVKPLPNDDLHKSRIGIQMQTDRIGIHLPHDVKISTAKILGPSAGLAFALGLFDARSSIDVLRGRFVVASGEVTLDGAVRAVGGIRQKAIASQNADAEILVLPIANAPLAQRTINEICTSKRCTRIVGVRSVRDAINQLRH